MRIAEARQIFERQLLPDSAFRAGLAIRLILLLFTIPLTYTEWFIPFVQHGSLTRPLDPWGSHLAVSSDIKAFPYGVAMYLVVLPGTAIGSLLGYLTGVPRAAQVGLGLTMLLLDLLLMVMLAILRPLRPRRLVVLYWLSPIVIFICYWHGHLDIVPVALLVLSLLLLQQHRPTSSAAVMAAAVSAKLSMALAPPFVLLYLWVSKRRRSQLQPYVITGAVTSLALHMPVALSPAARAMVLGTPELDKVYDFAITLSDGLEIYFIPVAYMLLLLTAWLLRRISFELLSALLGVGFLVIVLMTPAAPGWYLWVVPFLVLSFVMARLRMTLCVVAHGLLFTGFHLLKSTGASVPGLGWDLTAPWSTWLPITPRMMSIVLSLLFAAGLVLLVLLLREGILRNDYFRLSRRPLLIGIAGDSGSGKDTLATSLAGLFGSTSIVHVSGDDYHLWDRHKPMWQIMTHLNPRANNLAQFKRDVLTLLSGTAIQNPHYDHGTGRMSRPRTMWANDVVIASGLHALFDLELCAHCDVRIFLDMSDDLRRFLKVQRDVHSRGHSFSSVIGNIERRQTDRDRFILPQKCNADIIFALQPLHPDLINCGADRKASLPRLKLTVSLRQGVPFEQIVRTLVGICGMHVEVVQNDFHDPVEITLEGEIEAEDVAIAAREIVNNLDELLAAEPIWESGPSGLMQLFVLNLSAYSLRRRLS